MKPIDASYPSHEKLKRQKEIDFLFAHGQRCFHYPFLLVYNEKEALDSWIKWGVSARKKNFKRAVDRNRIKRLMRECYRLHKNSLYEIWEGKAHIAMLFYCGKEIHSFSEMETKYLQLLDKLKKTF